MSTPVSAAQSYCSVADFLARYDHRFIGDQISDSGVKVDRDSLLATGNPANTRLQAILDDAAGMVESACVPGNRYTPTDLQTLTGVSLAFLKRLISDLAMGLILKRRPMPDKPVMPAYEEALGHLENLRLGQRIFGLQEAMDAGDPSNKIQDEQQRAVLNLASRQAGRFFGVRADNQRPFGG